MSKMGTTEEQYITLLEKLIDCGDWIQTRNSKTLTVFNETLRFTELPLVETRRTFWKGAIREMEWFLSGSNNLNDLHPSIHHWWKPWAKPNGKLWGIYGQQFRKYNGLYDQIDNAIKLLKNDPASRRIVITAWHPQDVSNPGMALPPCHGTTITLNVSPKGVLHMLMVQRSVDVMLGLPHNLVQYWALLQYFASVAKLKIGSFTWVGSNIHIYEPHILAAKELIKHYLNNKREYSQNHLIYTPSSTKFSADDFTLMSSYQPKLKFNLPLIV